MERATFNTDFDALVGADTLDLTKADELKTSIGGVFDELENSQKDCAFYIKQIDDLKRQNRALYLKTAPVVEVEQPAIEKTPEKTPYQLFSEGFDKLNIKL